VTSDGGLRLPPLPYRLFCLQHHPAGGVHVKCRELKLRIKDGLPKIKDLPREMGGSGVAVAE